MLRMAARLCQGTEMFSKLKLRRLGLSGSSSRVLGDSARDQKDWPAAERAYFDHLRNNPDDFAILVQYGHSLKEQGRLPAAEEAYRKAAVLNQGEGDAQLQLGHLLKRMARTSEAAGIFEDLLRRTGSQEAFVELKGLRSTKYAVGILAEIPSSMSLQDVVYIELDDMLGYLEAHKTLSGIQRVQAGVIQHILALEDVEAGRGYAFVLNIPEAERLWVVRREDIASVVGYATSEYVDHTRLKAFVATARRNATMVVPKKGQSCLILGAFWGHGGVALRHAYLKRLGVAVGAYVYDLIPISHAEYCDQGLPHEFALSLGEGLQVFDYVLTISEYTASEVRRYIEKFGLDPLPVVAVPLAHASSDVVREQKPSWTPNIALLRDRPFVLMVSTIEARKNHAYLVTAWKSFLDEGLNPPDLVFVGRVGWRVASLMEMLETSRYHDGRVHILQDLSDAELNTLYDACLFTVFPSFVEGWGLPIGESLAHGKPCVASSTSSMPEVGGDLVDYVDPFNLGTGMEILRRMTFDSVYRQRRSTEIKENFKPRTWRQVGADLLRQIEEIKKSSAGPRNPEPYLMPGSVFRPGDLASGRKIPENYPRSPCRLMLARSWYGVEVHGCWMRGNSALLEFRTGLASKTRIAVCVQIYGSPMTTAEHRLTLKLGERPCPGSITDEAVVTRIPSSSYHTIRIRGQVGEGGMVSVHLTLEGEVPPEDEDAPFGRRPAVGLAAMGYAPLTDLATRIELMDNLFFQPLG